MGPLLGCSCRAGLWRCGYGELVVVDCGVLCERFIVIKRLQLCLQLPERPLVLHGQLLRVEPVHRILQVPLVERLQRRVVPNVVMNFYSLHQPFDEKTIDFILKQYDPDLREAIQIEIKKQK